ncbi:MAG TPA: hypothetical protein VHX42_02325 [Candidatus Babeliales bacterium]|jgi:hypothetical protein|nr:hypothetical protein [Candidatus Babeliales bacterium]
MNNKQLFLLPLFLFVSTTIQCIITVGIQSIDQTTVAKPKTIQEIQNDRENIYKKRTRYLSEYPLAYFLLQCEWDNFFSKLIDEEKSYNFCACNLMLHKIKEKKGYSFLGLTAIALNNHAIPHNSFATSYNLEKIFHSKNQASFHAKKEYIQLLLPIAYKMEALCKVKITPTPEDKEFALLEKWERCAPLIIKKIHSFQHIPLLSEIQKERKEAGQETALMQQNFIRYISLLMWKLEESLF